MTPYRWIAEKLSPTAEVLLAEQLKKAKIDLLTSQETREDSEVRAAQEAVHSKMLRERITRLTTHQWVDTAEASGSRGPLRTRAHV